MSFQTVIYLLILIFAVIISAFLTWYTWRHRQTEGAKSFSLLMLILFEWGLFYLFQITSTDLNTKMVWSRLVFLGVVTTPVLWLLFALEFTGRKRWITCQLLIVLFIVPILTTLVIWTNNAHH